MRAGQLKRGYPLLRAVFDQCEQHIDVSVLGSWAEPLGIYAVLRGAG